MGDLHPHLIHDSLGQSSPHTKQHLNWFCGNKWPIESRHFQWPWLTFEVIHLLEGFSNAIFHTVVQQLTRFQLTYRVSRCLSAKLLYSVCRTWSVISLCLFRTTKQVLSLEQRLLQIAQEELNETLRTIEADRQKISALQQEQAFTVRQIKDAMSKSKSISLLLKWPRSREKREFTLLVKFVCFLFTKTT